MVMLSKDGRALARFSLGEEGKGVNIAIAEPGSPDPGLKEITNNNVTPSRDTRFEPRSKYWRVPRKTSRKKTQNRTHVTARSDEEGP